MAVVLRDRLRSKGVVVIDHPPDTRFGTRYTGTVDGVKSQFVYGVEQGKDENGGLTFYELDFKKLRAYEHVAISRVLDAIPRYPSLDMYEHELALLIYTYYGEGKPPEHEVDAEFVRKCKSHVDDDDDKDDDDEEVEELINEKFISKYFRPLVTIRPSEDAIKRDALSGFRTILPAITKMPWSFRLVS